MIIGFNFLFLFIISVFNKFIVHEDTDGAVVFVCVRTVTNSRLTYVSKLAFQNNIKLQYL